MKKVSRKNFISTSLSAMAGIILFRNGLPEIFNMNDLITSTGSGQVLVGMAGNRDTTYSLVRKAVELAGGMDFINKGDSVLIKPNLNTGDPPPASTNPEVVREVIEMVKEKDPSKIVVGDKSSFWSDTLSCMKQNGLYDVINQTGAEAFPLDDDKWIGVKPKEAANWKMVLRFQK